MMSRTRIKVVIAGIVAAVPPRHPRRRLRRPAPIVLASFSSHAGIVPATGGEESVGGFVSVSVRESEVPPGQQISAVTRAPREDCGL